MARKHMAMYGTFKLQRGICPSCKTTAIIRGGLFLCCDRPANLGRPQNFYQMKRMTCAEAVRRKPSFEARRRMLERQDNKCIYCDIPFGTAYQHPKLKKILTTYICYDHFVPYAYSQNNQDTNFVGACRICNGIKSSKMFNTMEDAKAYVQYRRAKKGYTQEAYIL